jgi:hypothetical protein
MKTSFKTETTQTVQHKQISIFHCDYCDFQSPSISDTVRHEASHLDVKELIINGHTFYKAKDASTLKKYINAIKNSDDAVVAWDGEGWYGIQFFYDDPIFVVKAERYIKEIKENAIKERDEAIQDYNNAEKLEKEFFKRVKENE